MTDHDLDRVVRFYARMIAGKNDRAFDRSFEYAVAILTEQKSHNGYVSPSIMDRALSYVEAATPRAQQEAKRARIALKQKVSEQWEQY